MEIIKKFKKFLTHVTRSRRSVCHAFFVPHSLLTNADISGVNFLLVLAGDAKPIQLEINVMKLQEMKT